MHTTSLSNHCSASAPIHSCIPQGSILGPILFTMYIKPLSAIIDSHSIIHHSFADDPQIQMSAPHDEISELLHSMQSCICDVKAWETENMAKLNDNRTELMLVTSKRTMHLHSLPTSITIGNDQIHLHLHLQIHLKSLHWLHVKVRSTYKLACLCYHCHHHMSLTCCMKSHCTPATLAPAHAPCLFFNRPAHSKATLGDRSFSFASSSVWNSIPNDVRCAPSLSSFKSRLKTYLFRSVYKD